MSEGHGDPPADVRSFLPRPGEPVEQYAERLRVLHRDLTLVLQAVERGLAAAARPEDLGPPVPAHEPIEIVPEPAEQAAPTAAPPLAPRSRMPRVEVMPAPSAEQRRDDQEDRRRPPAPEEPAPRWAKEDGPGDGSPDGPDPVERGLPRPARFPARPSVASAGHAREPQWVERGEGFTAPTFPPSQAHRLQLSPLLVAGFALAWLVVVGLLVALLVS
jgi:hypothetical protein